MRKGNVRACVTQINVNDSYIGEPIEYKIKRIVDSKEPIGDTVQMIYTERKEGVQPAYDIRTDRFDIAIDAFDKIDKTIKAKRAEKLKTTLDEAGSGATEEAINA